MTFNLERSFWVEHQKNRQRKEKKKKISELDFKILNVKGHYQQIEKVTHKMGVNICRAYI